MMLRLSAALTLVAAAAWSQTPPPPRPIDLRTADGTILKATFFPAAKPGPGVILHHQSNRTRQSWNALATQLAAAGIHTLTVDSRGFGESGGTKHLVEDDTDTALEFLAAQPGVTPNAIGMGGAGSRGVHNAVETARRHPAAVRSLVLISGETLLPQLRFLRQATQLPGLFIVADDDEYPPTSEAMEWLYVTSGSAEKQFIHYVTPKAPWLWYETSDPAKVPATGSHGTDLFSTHPELPGTIVQWFVTTLIQTPGHATPDAVASAATLLRMEQPGGVAELTQALAAARRKDPKAQLWPEVNVDIIGEDHVRAGEIKEGIEIFRLNLLAYPDSADAHFNLADAYFRDGQKALARQYAERALAMVDSHAAPLSSWSDTEQRRAEIRQSIRELLDKLAAP